MSQPPFQPPIHGYYPQPQPAYPPQAPPGPAPSAAGGIVSLLLAVLSLGVLVIVGLNLATVMRMSSGDSSLPLWIRAEFIQSSLTRALIFLSIATFFTLTGLLAGVLGRRATVGKVAIAAACLVFLGDMGGWAAYAIQPAAPKASPRRQAEVTRGSPSTETAGGRASTGKYSTREMTWVLGTKLALAALGKSRGAPADVVSRVFDDAKTIAKALGTTVPPLARVTGNSAKDSAAALHYLLDDAGKPLSAHLSAQYGADHAALLELAFKAETLTALYVPGDKLGLEIAERSSVRPPRRTSPRRWFGRLIDAVKRRATFEEVKRQVSTMERGVGAHLTATR